MKLRIDSGRFCHFGGENRSKNRPLLTPEQTLRRTLNCCATLFWLVARGPISTLAPSNALHRLKPGKRLSFTSARSASSSATVRGFPCCIATAQSTLDLLAASRENSHAEASSSHAVAIANDFLNPHPRFDWRRRPQTQSPTVASTSSSTDASKRKLPPKRVPPPHADLQIGDPYFDEVKAYQEHFLPLLEFEQQSDEAVLRERLNSWSLERLQKEGYCITDMSAYWLDSPTRNFGMGRFVAGFVLGPGVLLPAEHHFENGTQVLVTHLDPLKEVPYRGSVIQCSETQLRIAFNEKFELDDGKPWRVDITSSTIAYQRMKAAIQSLHHDPAQQLRLLTPSPTHKPASSAFPPREQEIMLQGTYLRDVLLRGFRPSVESTVHDSDSALDPPPSPPTSLSPFRNFFAPDAHLSSWARRYARPNPVVVEGDPDLRSRGLNDTQIRAVAVMLGGMAGPLSPPPPPVLSESEDSEDGPLPTSLSPAPAEIAVTQDQPTPAEGERRMALVLGPPGTGKTKTIIEAVRMLKQHFALPFPILLCTYTNVAVDNLVEGLVRHSSSSSKGRAATPPLRPLRIGSPGKVRAALDAYTLETQLAAHKLAPELEQVRTRLQELVKRRRELHMRIRETRAKVGLAPHQAASSPARASAVQSSHGQGVPLAAVGKELPGARTAGRGLTGRLEAMELDMINMEKQSKTLSNKAYRLWADMVHDIVKSADVICTTCITSASSTLNMLDFPIVFIDEASMSTEPASLIPLMKGSQHVALIGDHKQLPPVITSPEAQDQGLGVSLFERLAEENFLPSIMLDIQYRMHPTISHFPSREFYNQELRDGTVDEQGNVVPGLVPPESRIYPELVAATRRSASMAGVNTDLSQMGVTVGDKSRPSVVFLDHVGGETPKDKSCMNQREAHIVCSLVEDLLLRNPTLTGDQIGIIAPYAAQITLLTRLLTTDKARLARFTTVLGPKRAAEVAAVEVKTVDGFEGREKEVIIFSTVRNNPAGFIGFLADRRRLNVGLTRAKRGLFVVGSIGTLKASKGRTRSATATAADAADALEDRGVAVDEAAATETAVGGKVKAVKRAKSRTGKGAEAWRRYAAFLTEERLVVRLEGDRLNRLLYGNLEDVEGPGATSVGEYRSSVH